MESQTHDQPTLGLAGLGWGAVVGFLAGVFAGIALGCSAAVIGSLLEYGDVEWGEVLSAMMFFSFLLGFGGAIVGTIAGAITGSLIGLFRWEAAAPKICGGVSALAPVVYAGIALNAENTEPITFSAVLMVIAAIVGFGLVGYRAGVMLRNKLVERTEIVAAPPQPKVSSGNKRFGSLMAAGVLALVAIFFISKGGDEPKQDAFTEVGDVLDLGVDDTTEPFKNATSTTITTLPTVVPVTSTVVPASPLSLEGDCPASDGSGQRVTQFEVPQPHCIDLSKTHIAEVQTNVGHFTIQLDEQHAPITVNNFVTLARYRFYEGVTFHRVIPGFMVQGGDAVGDPLGTGGPGYVFDDELQGDEGPFFEVGSVAMANAGPNTNGSQFFVVTGPSGQALPDQYTLFGTVIAGMETITTIESTETGFGDVPLTPMIIESIDITEQQ